MTTKILKRVYVVRDAGLLWEWREIPLCEVKNKDLFVPIWEKSEKTTVLACTDAILVEDQGWSVNGFELRLEPYKAMGLYKALFELGLADHFRSILEKEFFKCHVCFADLVKEEAE